MVGPANRCGTPDSLLLTNLRRYEGNPLPLTNARSAMGRKLEYRLALDINHATYLLYRGDTVLIKKKAYALIDAASAVFERELGIKLSVVSLLIWDRPEPYTLADDFDYFDKVLYYWADNRFEERDAVVGLSVRSGMFYGGFRMLTSDFPPPDSYDFSVKTLCHELGHSLGSPHTHSCSWPGGAIDRCAAVEGPRADCPEGFGEQVNGTLMSYCIEMLTFHPYCRNLIRDYAEGKVLEPFRLPALREDGPGPGPPQPVCIRNTRPVFSWGAREGTERYQLQISENRNFTEVLEDTLIGQPFHQADMLAGGTYFVRVRCRYEKGTGSWSEALPFTVSEPEPENVRPWLKTHRIRSDGNVELGFGNPFRAARYEVELQNPGRSGALYFFGGNTSGAGIELLTFKIREEDFNPGLFAKVRVQANGVWSEWSEARKLQRLWDNRPTRSTVLSGASGTPVLAHRVSTGESHTGLTHYLEIAVDTAFSVIVARDSVVSNQAQATFTDKFVFAPALRENTTYRVRVRTSPAPGVYTPWAAYTLKTGFEDTRFRYKGNLPRLQLMPGSAVDSPPPTLFYNTGNTLYVQGAPGKGYYETTDLDTWKAVTAGSTKGKASDVFTLFAALPTGDVFTFTPPFLMIHRKPENRFEYTRLPHPLAFDGPAQAAATEKGELFFATADAGIGRYAAGNLHFFELPVKKARVLTADKKGGIWALLEGGGLYVFRDGDWNFHSCFPEWQAVNGLCFDRHNKGYLYGFFGVVFLREGRTAPEPVPLLDHAPVRKVVFDDEDRMWLASYKESSPFHFESYALMKYADGKLTRYTDGLNFLREAFDLAFFKGQLVIITTGGEIYTFDEKAIQRKELRDSYCAGDTLQVTVTSNSTFAPDNEFLLELRNVETGKVTVSGEPDVRGSELRIVLGPELAGGTYVVRTLSTAPALASHESVPFRVTRVPAPAIGEEGASGFTNKLAVKAAAGATLQWQCNGTDLPGETLPFLFVHESGNYTVRATNDAGCTAVSAPFRVTLPEPGGPTLLQNTPNPMDALAQIAFYLPAQGHARLELVALNGTGITTLREGRMPGGWHRLVFDGSSLPAGMYIYSLDFEGVRRSLKMMKK